MKIEMGESLFYSWLRHVKKCQMVQLNWKPSQSWPLHHEERLEALMIASRELFQHKYAFDIIRTGTRAQLLKQAEVDALGISYGSSGAALYAVDVAFHEGGLLYGSGRTDTAQKIMQKFLRTAMCVLGYFDQPQAGLYFAAPKISRGVLETIGLCLEDLNAFFQAQGLGFRAAVLANEDFNRQVMEPVLEASPTVADTSELFLRAYQLTRMFGGQKAAPVPKAYSVHRPGE